MIKNSPFHEKIAAILREEIRRDHETGDKLLSDRAQAERFDVSVITIGKAMEQLVREGLVRRQQGSGTFVTASSGGEKIALLVNDTILDRVAPYFWLTITRRVREQLIDHGFEVEMDLASVRPSANGNEVRGAIAIRAPKESPSAQYFLRRNMPVVGHDKSYTYCAHYNTEGLIRGGVDCLLKHGRRRLAMVATGPHPKSGNWLANHFQRILESRDVSAREDWICSVPGKGEGGHVWGRLHDIFEADGERPDGLLVADDTLYNEAVMALLSLDIAVPDELMVVTHANKGSGMFCPFPTTKLENDPQEYADAMVDMLETLLEGHEPDPPHVMLSFSVKQTGEEPDMSELGEAGTPKASVISTV